MRHIFCLLSILIFCVGLRAQEPEKLSSSEIYKEIQKLNFLGSALYVAAHPDDENTRLISYLSNHLNARTAYLSLTRGDGGQNLIGPELREMLGVIRTQELLAARKIDRAEQFFTRANDFGYSKNPSETLSIWNEEEILKDVVQVIRNFKPDIIINRFNAESAGETHGHHTSSALLSSKAFAIAGNNNVFPQQAKELGTWEPKKLFFNTSPWFYESNEAFEAADKSSFLNFDVGVYYPLQGLSNTEIASLSRSQHQSQGFGSTGSRGKETEYLELIKGQHPKNEKALFAGINTTWSRVKGGKEIGEILLAVEKNYDFKNPAASLPELLKAYQLISRLEDEHWKKQKSSEIKRIIAASAGLFMEAVAREALATPGEEVKLKLELVNRSNTDIQLLQVAIQPELVSEEIEQTLSNNQTWRKELQFTIPEDFSYSSPYWLREKGSLGMYSVENPSLRGLAETPALIRVKFLLQIEGVEIPFEKNIIYKFNDPVQGETYQPFEIVPPLSVQNEADVLVFENQEPKRIAVTVRAVKDSVTGSLSVPALGSWQVSPLKQNFGPLRKGAESTFYFELIPPKNQETLIFQPIAELEGKEYSKSIVQLDYEHIPLQTLVLPNQTRLVKLDIQKRGNLIGYIQGAGDLVPQGLEQIGYEVEVLNPTEISAENLKKYDAVVMGIRAYNTVDALEFKQKDLLEYVRTGGNLILQYNTNRGLKTEQLAPYPLQLSRDRVTNENAEVRFIAPDHPALNFPNKITAADFEGWVQERGLYFPDQWAPQFTALLSMNDPGETPKNGSLLVAPYGEGHYIYTGLSFFREFPAGVPGAFRLFANLVSLGKEENKIQPAENSN